MVYEGLNKSADSVRHVVAGFSPRSGLGKMSKLSAPERGLKPTTTFSDQSKRFIHTFIDCAYNQYQHPRVRRGTGSYLGQQNVGKYKLMSSIPWRGFVGTLKRDWRFVVSCAVVAAAILYYLWK